MHKIHVNVTEACCKALHVLRMWNALTHSTKNTQLRITCSVSRVCETKRIHVGRMRAHNRRTPRDAGCVNGWVVDDVGWGVIYSVRGAYLCMRTSVNVCLRVGVWVFVADTGAAQRQRCDSRTRDSQHVSSTRVSRVVRFASGVL